MKFSTRTTYGLRSMIRLARHYGQGSLSLATIAKEEDISLPYLERIFVILKKAKLVDSSKGSAGGYELAHSPQKITILDIIRPLEGKISAFHCLSEDGELTCAHGGCGAAAVLGKVQNAINDTLRGIRLGDLAK